MYVQIANPVLQKHCIYCCCAYVCSRYYFSKLRETVCHYEDILAAFFIQRLVFRCWWTQAGLWREPIVVLSAVTFSPITGVQFAMSEGSIHAVCHLWPVVFGTYPIVHFSFPWVTSRCWVLAKVGSHRTVYGWCIYLHYFLHSSNACYKAVVVRDEMDLWLVDQLHVFLPHRFQILSLK